ncbi:MAG: hypothetical protein LBS91_07155 [Clostridiales Family XIII bacterium]|jgi:ribose transport system permease protein|nr:hypothetical protein [Clostridiales Family XIII bacterium]
MSNSVNIKKTLIPIFVFIALIVLFALVFNLATHGKFLNAANINNILSNAILASFTAWGFCFIMALNYMDLSVGAVIMIAVYVSGEAGNAFGVPALVVCGLAVGVAVMTLNFAIFTWTRVPSWVAGLGLALIYEGCISIYQKYKETLGGNLVYLDTKYGILGRAPLIYVAFAIGLILAYILYNRSALGLNARSVGSNPNVARAMGINITRTLIMTGIVSGIFIGCAGFLRESFSAGSVIPVPQSLSSLAVIFPGFAAIFIAQVLGKWINMIIAVPFCAMLIYLCYNVFAMTGVPLGTISETMIALFIIIFGLIAQRGNKGVVK